VPYTTPTCSGKRRGWGLAYVVWRAQRGPEQGIGGSARSSTQLLRRLLIPYGDQNGTTLGFPYVLGA
jgi:hypothetical protein